MRFQLHDLVVNMSEGFAFSLQPAVLLAIAGGVVFGILVGALPGLSPAMGVALLIPFTYEMPASVAIAILVAVYLAAGYGGSITAVTINAPGTPSSAVTAFDGYALTQQGQPGMGLGISLVASTVGGFVGALVLILFSGRLAELALKCQPPEYFALAVFGLTSVASIGGKNAAKAFAMVVLGLMLNTIGTDPIAGVSRFTFGLPQLYNGFSLIPALIGLFAISEVLVQIATGDLSRVAASQDASQWPSFRDYWRLKFAILRSSLLGTLIGIFPGAGATIAAFVSYDVARRLSREPELFGHGSHEGVAAAEAANSSSVGGALVPLLTLGIPGSASTAVLIGALMIHRVVPGPQMFEKHAPLVYGMFASLLLANVMLLLFGSVGSRLWVNVTAIPKEMLYPLILSVSVVGSYAVRYSVFDVVSCLGFGFLGWILRRQHYPVAPIVLGLVLGSIAEREFRKAVIMGGYTIFATRPACLIILLVSLASLAIPWLRSLSIFFSNDNVPADPPRV